MMSASHKSPLAFERTHSVICGLMQALQDCFQHDTLYDRPLIPPQHNVAYAVDFEIAQSMADYMAQALVDKVGLTPGEFRIVHKGDMGLQRLRLEFTQGMTGSMISRLEAATRQLSSH